MKISRIYCQNDRLFGPIDFNEGLSVVLAEIRLHGNTGVDTHNLGKSLLARLLDYCLLMQRSREFFLFKHEDKFGDFVFYLELAQRNGSYLTIRRSVQAASKVSFKKHRESGQDYRNLDDDGWDHANLPFKKAKSYLDSVLALRSLGQWDFRDAIGYLLRAQDDYTNVFQLDKVKRAAHSDWKPYLSHMLGFESTIVQAQYEVEDEIDSKKARRKVIVSEIGTEVADASKIEGLLLLKKSEAEKKQAQLDRFDFHEHDADKTTQLVEELNASIARLNSERYFLRANRKRIKDSISTSGLNFDPERAQQLFDEAGIVFSGQIKHDFEQLIGFKKSITIERRKYLRADLKDVEARLAEVSDTLKLLGKQRVEALAVLSETDEVQKYKDLSDELVVLKADIELLERQREGLQKLKQLQDEIIELEEKRDALVLAIGKDVDSKNEDKTSHFSQIRLHFNDIVESVIGLKALILVDQNKEGHLQFSAEILGKRGDQTSADAGFTYRKLLCIALDMAVLRANAGREFPLFVYHDGVFESLDDRKKANLLVKIREYCSAGIQQVITLIDSDMPSPSASESSAFADHEIVLRLHDEGEKGRLFRMPSW